MFSNFQVLEMVSPARQNRASANFNIKLRGCFAAVIVDNLPPSPQAAKILLGKMRRLSVCEESILVFKIL